VKRSVTKRTANAFAILA